MGETWPGPGVTGQMVSIRSSQPLTGKYVVIQLKGESQILNLNEVKITAEIIRKQQTTAGKSSIHGSGNVLETVKNIKMALISLRFE